jgi:hypothetical protein
MNALHLRLISSPREGMDEDEELDTKADLPGFIGDSSLDEWTSSMTRVFMFFDFSY